MLPGDVLLEIFDFYVVQPRQYVEEWRILVSICRLNSLAYRDMVSVSLNSL